jgi:hypothetical protein
MIELVTESYVNETGSPLEVISLLSSLSSEARDSVSGTKESGTSAKLPAMIVSSIVID